MLWYPFLVPGFYPLLSVFQSLCRYCLFGKKTGKSILPKRFETYYQTNLFTFISSLLNLTKQQGTRLVIRYILSGVTLVFNIHYSIRNIRLFEICAIFIQIRKRDTDDTFCLHCLLGEFVPMLFQ